MIRILSVVSYKVFPPVFGGQKGIALFSKYLAKRFPLLCLCAKNNDATWDKSFSILPHLPESKLQFINPFTISKVISTAKKDKSTHMIVEHPYHGIAGWLSRVFTGTKLIIHSHNIEYTRFKAQKKWWWPLLKVYEKWAHRRADLNLFKTEDDLSFAVKKFRLNAERCIVIPYGIDEPVEMAGQDARELIRKRHGIGEEEKILLFAGTLDYDPNAKAMEDIYRIITPLLDFPHKIIICGRIRFDNFQYLKSLNSPNVVYAGEVPDISEYYYAADAFINPVSSGGGIQTKTIEALSYGCNVICFDHMLQGIPVRLVKNKLFPASEGDWEGFAKQSAMAVNRKAELMPAFLDAMSWEKHVETVVKRIEQL